MSHALTHEVDVALAAVRQAARLCQAVQAGIEPGTLEKKDKSPVTVADFGSQAVICRALREAFPDDPIVAEEDSNELRRPENAALAERVVEHVRGLVPAADREQTLAWIDEGGATAPGRRFWTLDPIDGTKGFLRGQQYAVALALIVDGQIAVAALACPNLPDAAGSGGTAFTAVRGQGTLAFPLAAGPSQPARVSPQADIRQARFCESVESAHSKQDLTAEVARRLGISAAPVRMDSQAKYAVVARGGAEIYLRLPTRADYREKIWDHAAGALVIAEAGGQVTDVLGRPLDFTRGTELTANRGIVATNGLLHEQVLAALAALNVA